MLICLSVSSSNQIYVRSAKNAKEAWDSLESHFEEKTLSKKIYYRTMLYSLKMEKGTPMISHVNKLKTISEHLEALNDAPPDKDLVMILISSLPREYNNLITSLETLKEEQLTWTYVRDRVLNEYERKKLESKPLKGNHDALYLGQGNNGRNQNNNNHNKQKKGPVKANNKENGKSNFKCHYCHEKGHFKRECPKKNANAEKKDSASFCKSEQAKDEHFEVALQVVSCPDLHSDYSSASDMAATEDAGTPEVFEGRDSEICEGRDSAVLFGVSFSNMSFTDGQGLLKF